MNYDNVKFGSDARSKIIEGANLAAAAVEVTYGPHAATVLIRKNGLLKSTKDGATVMDSVNDPDPYIQMGIDVIKEASIRQAKTVGDGSTTVAILANEIINQYKDNPDPIKVSRYLKKAGEEIIEYLKKYKKEISSLEDIKKVATLAANNDSTIGDIIAEAFYKVGKDGLVTYQESEDVKDRVEYTEGFRIDNGYESPYFINTSKNECVLENCIVYISDTKLDEGKAMEELAGKAYKEGKSLLLIAPEFESGLTLFLARNMFNKDGSKKLMSCEVTSPNFGVMRETMLEDMRILFGETSECEKVVITKDSTTFTGYHPSDRLEARIQSVRDTLKDSILSEIEEMFHQKRLANFTSGMATIYVGGFSQVEMKERCDRFEDAIMATKCAMDGGVLPGGGLALAKIATCPSEIIDETSKEFSRKFKEVLYTPYRKIFKGDVSWFEKQCGPIVQINNDDKFENYQIESYDLDFNEQVFRETSTSYLLDFWQSTTNTNFYKEGIIDPYLVVKATIENAISVASTILTTNCTILNI